MRLKVLGAILLFASYSTLAESPVQPVENTNSANNMLIPSTALVPVKSQVCAACHGVDGNSTVGMWPKLAGQHKGYLVRELKEFQKGDKGGRNDPSMVAMAQGLSDADIEEISAFYAKQKPTPGGAKAEFVSKGEKLYRGGNSTTGVSACIACHGPKGEGNDLANYPKISGQQIDYTMTELKKFRTGTRSNDPNGIMRDIAKRMTDEDIQAVSDYVSGLH